MLDKVKIKVSALNFERLCELHRTWDEGTDEEIGQTMNYVIGRLLDISDVDTNIKKFEDR